MYSYKNKILSVIALQISAFIKIAKYEINDNICGYHSGTGRIFLAVGYQIASLDILIGTNTFICKTR